MAPSAAQDSAAAWTDLESKVPELVGELVLDEAAEATMPTV